MFMGPNWDTDIIKEMTRESHLACKMRSDLVLEENKETMQVQEREGIQDQSQGTRSHCLQHKMGLQKR